jgi:alkyl sulfatase BDS1-like metallo-beta-lactamase superfamily hydrolase
MELVFDSMGVRLNGVKADGKKTVLHWRLTDPSEEYTMRLENAALTHETGAPAQKADAIISLSRETWNAVAAKELTLPGALAAGKVKIEGTLGKVVELFGLLDDAVPDFNIIEPLKLRP